MAHTIFGPVVFTKHLRGPKARLLGISAVWAVASVAAAFAAVPAAADGPYYYIVNSATKMVADVFAFSADDGAQVVLWPQVGGPNQQFTVERIVPQMIFQPRKNNGSCCGRDIPGNA